jgi:cobalt/nickel transport system permease protein
MIKNLSSHHSMPDICYVEGDGSVMHIPDGYLSPSTCAALYTVSAPFLYVALKKVKSRLHTKLVPRLALFAAFSFVVMMFNVPLPGGTSGHATGVGLATVVLGPWAGMLALSTAILIQALFFGDGGITAFGANAFNMAIAGCLVTYAIYRVLSKAFGKRTWSQPMAAGIAAYLAINVSALLAAIEFGIQPMLFKDAAGHPLYSPFPLHVAIPAMLIGHLTIAGLAEFVITAGVISYLQRTSPGLLMTNREKSSSALRWRPVIAVLAALIILTPLGLLTMGHAWGEWSAGDFKNPAARTEIVKATAGSEIPTQAPSGLQRLEKVWAAPFRNYAPRFIGNTSVGYIFSAIMGVAFLVLLILTLGALAKRTRPPDGEKPV